MDLEKSVKKSGRSALGRGLSALISTPPVAVPERGKASGGAPSVQGGNLAVKEAPTLTPEAPKVLVEPEAPTAAGRSRDSAISVIEAPKHEQSEGDGQAKTGVRFVKVTDLVRNPKQPRQIFTETELAELADSIRASGVLQPILVRVIGDVGEHRYEIVAGERRWRAAQRAELVEVPVIIREFDDRETLEIGLVENLQRVNLNPIEEALAYQRLIDEFHLTHVEVAQRVGKDRVTISNTTRLLKLPADVLDLVRNNELSAGHARALLPIRQPDAQVRLAKKVIAEKLSVRELEAMVARAVVLDAGKTSTKSVEVPGQGATSLSNEPTPIGVEDRLRAALGTKIKVRHHASGKGKIEIEYFSESELDRVIDTICAPKVLTA